MGILDKIKKDVQKEIRYIRGLYPFDILKYFDHGLLYAKSVLSYFDDKTRSVIGLASKDMKRLSGLATGIELLGIGLTLHMFDSGKDSDDDYVVELLIGDITYARAIHYLLEYGDFNIFRLILDSLKRSHEKRLIIHARLVEAISEERLFDELKEIAGNRLLLIETNYLLKESYRISRTVFHSLDLKKDIGKYIEEITSKVSDIEAIRHSVEEISQYLSKKDLTEKERRRVLGFMGEKALELSEEISVLQEDLKKAKDLVFI